MRRFKSIFADLVVALLAIGSALLVRRAILVPLFDRNVPLITFALAVVAATWASSLQAGVFATLLGAVANNYLSIDGSGFHLRPLVFQLRLFLFVAIGLLVSWLVGSQQSARRRTEERRRQLEVEIVERRKAEAAEREQRDRLAEEMRRREQAEILLREREERIRLAVESANIGTFDFNPLTGERNWSPRTKVMWGLPPDADVTNVTFLDRVHPEDRERVGRAFQAALDPRGDGTYDIDCRVVWPDGSIHWFVAKGQALFEGQPPERRATRFIGTVLEITDRKQTETALRQALETVEANRELLRGTIELQDQERQLIAYEIHDGLVQYVAGAQMRMEAMRERPESEPLATEIDNLVGILRGAVEEGRRLINGIRTPVLDDWGIVAAVQQLIDEEDRANVQIEFVKDDGLGRLAPRLEETLYRITQEALTNTCKHSQSQKVRIELARQGDRVHLEIRDWGVGFASSDGPAKGHGLRGMAQRARTSGGEWRVDSAPGKGTHVVVDLPYLGSG